MAKSDKSISSKSKKTTIPDPTAEELVERLKIYSELESPIEISTVNVTNVTLPKLLWYNVLVRPVRTKMTNNGHTVFVTSKWRRSIPFLSGGPLLDDYFCLYNFHFHWGSDDGEGSEHIFKGEQLSLEMHVLWRNKKYQTAKEAKSNSDGIIIIVYLFQTTDFDNNFLKPIVDNLKSVRKANTSAYMPEQLAASQLLPQFENDYLLYAGSLRDSNPPHQLLWLIQRQIHPIGYEQLEEFRKLLKPNGFENERNYRQAVYSEQHLVYHVLHTERLGTSLLLPLVKPDSKPKSAQRSTKAKRQTRLKKDGSQLCSGKRSELEDYEETSGWSSEASRIPPENKSESSFIPQDVSL